MTTKQRIYKVTYTTGIREFIEAFSNGSARALAKRLHPDHAIRSVAIAEELKGLPFTPWNLLVHGQNRMRCATCDAWIVPSRVWDPVKDVERRPCHDVEGNAFCNTDCRARFATATTDVVVFDYDTWEHRTEAIPCHPQARDAWAEKWTLVEVAGVTVIIETDRYRRMMHRAMIAGDDYI